LGVEHFRFEVNLTLLIRLPVTVNDQTVYTFRISNRTLIINDWLCEGSVAFAAPTLTVGLVALF
jgi:hypothetical protein